MSSVKGQEDFEFMTMLIKYEQQNYNELKEKCVREGVLFEDELFPPSRESYYLPKSLNQKQGTRKIEWIRPHQIALSGQPHFVNDKSASKKTFGLINVIRGHGSQNFVAALSVLHWKPHFFARVVPQDQSFESNQYTGMFHFFIWQYGKWYDIVVDDRLPTINGKLIQTHTFNDAEFWPALLEKAFAKLNGCYQSLLYCTVGEFLEDMTGGLCENINSMSDILNEGLFRILSNALRANSHTIVRIRAQEKQSDSESEIKSESGEHHTYCALKRLLPNGLLRQQSYIVLDTKVFDYYGQDRIVYLIKICNPWKRLNQLLPAAKCKYAHNKEDVGASQSGFDGNWNGSWSETSSELVNLPDAVKLQYGLANTADHEFWMPIESFAENFTDVDICHSACTTNTTIKEDQLQWHSYGVQGYWISGVSAGGCYNQNSFHQNPIYLIPILTDKPESGIVKSKSQDTKTAKRITILVDLMQKYRGSKLITGVPDLKIGFHLFKLDNDDWKFVEEMIYGDNIEGAFTCEDSIGRSKGKRVSIIVKMKPEFFQSTQPGEHVIRFFTNVREVSARYNLSEGYYLVIPSTYAPNQDGNFLLRFYCEVPFKFNAKEISSYLPNDALKHIDKTYFLNRFFSRPIDKIGVPEECYDVESLEVLLRSVITYKRNYFNFDQCLTLLALYDLDYKGSLSHSKLQQMCIDIDECYQLFLKHDKTGSGTISPSELKAALEKTGIYANQPVVRMLVNRYGNHRKIVVKGIPIRELKFSNFALCMLKLRKALVYWDTTFRSSSLPLLKSDYRLECNNTHQSDEGNAFNLTLIEFVQQMIYS